jgi:hypothetical protein
MRPSAARSRPRPGQHDPAAAEPRQQDLGDGPHREQAEHDGTLDGVAALVQHASDEAGYQRTEQPEQREGGEDGHGGGDELAPAPLGDAEPGEAQGRPGAGVHRLGDEQQEQGRRRQDRQVHLEDQRGGMWRVLGEQPGDQGAETQAVRRPPAPHAAHGLGRDAGRVGGHRPGVDNRSTGECLAGRGRLRSGP